LNALGTQILLELKECNRDILNDMSYIREAMLGAAREVGATVLGETFHKFAPQGVTGLVSIAESHLCIHTWPEYGYAAVDVFTCGEGFVRPPTGRRVPDSEPPVPGALHIGG